MAKGWRHPDVKWRNVGVYMEQGALKAIVFDLDGIESSNDDVWVEDACEYLQNGCDKH